MIIYFLMYRKVFQKINLVYYWVYGLGEELMFVS